MCQTIHAKFRDDVLPNTKVIDTRTEKRWSAKFQIDIPKTEGLIFIYMYIQTDMVQSTKVVTLIYIYYVYPILLLKGITNFVPKLIYSVQVIKK